MKMGNFLKSIFLVLGGIALAASPAIAGKKKRPVKLIQCKETIGTVTVIEGDARSWVNKKLGTPNKVIEAMISESNCFDLFDLENDREADFIMTVVAGDQIEVAKATNLNNDQMTSAAALAQNSSYRNGMGTVGDVASMIPLAGAVINGAAGLVGIGKKTTIATGFSLIDTKTAQAVAAGRAFVGKTKLKFHDDDDDAMATMPEGYWMNSVEKAAKDTRYTKSENGRELVQGFVMAYNNLVAQARAMGIRSAAVIQQEAQPTVTAPNIAAQAESEDDDRISEVIVAVNSALYLEPNRQADPVRSIRAGMKLQPIGELEGIFLPVKDSYGVLGWVSVEDLE